VSGGSAVAGLDVAAVTSVGVIGAALVSIPFTYINPQGNQNTLSVTKCSRPYNKSVTAFISLKAIVFVNRWGFALSVQDDGKISHRNRNRQKDGWEGWVI